MSDPAQSTSKICFSWSDRGTFFRDYITAARGVQRSKAMSPKVKALLMTAGVTLGVLFLYDRGYLTKIGLPQTE